MQHLPKQARITVTKEEYLGSFETGTRMRVERWMEIEGGYRAVMEFCMSDEVVAGEETVSVGGKDFGREEERSVISESLSGLIPPEESDEEPHTDYFDHPDGFTTPEQPRGHERTGTTIYRSDATESEDSPSLKPTEHFSPGTLVERLILSLQRMMEMDLEEVKLVMVRDR